MDSFDGSRRREGRAPSAPPERFTAGEPRAQRPAGARSLREPEPLEQRLDRWMSTGRQLVEGVSGGRPGSRPGTRRPDGRPGGRNGFDGLGRWVEDRLDWLLDDSEDWPEPWQDRPRRRGDTPQGQQRDVSPTPEGGASPLQARDSWQRDPGSGRDGDPPGSLLRDPLPGPPGGETRRRRLEAVSRRGARGAGGASRLDGEQDWPDDETFSLPRWQRPTAPLRRPDPLRSELEERPRSDDAGLRSEPSAAARPLPRSSRRR